jgi:hypothetical protein
LFSNPTHLVLHAASLSPDVPATNEQDTKHDSGPNARDKRRVVRFFAGHGNLDVRHGIAVKRERRKSDNAISARRWCSA